MDRELNQFSDTYAQKGRVEHFALFGNYLDRLESEVKEADLRLAEIQPELTEEQQKVLEARKKRRIVEILKERARKQYDQEYRKQERKQIEELNLMRQSQSEQEGWDKTDEDKHKQHERTDKAAAMDREAAQEEEWQPEPDKPKDPVAEYLKEHGLDPSSGK